MILFMQDFLHVKNVTMFFIHDGARPFISEEIIKRGLDGTKKTGACVVGMPSKDTVKLADEEGYCKRDAGKESCLDSSDTPGFSVILLSERLMRVCRAKI